MKKNSFPNVSKSVGRRYFYTQWKECQLEQNFKDPFNKMNQNLKIIVSNKASWTWVFGFSGSETPNAQVYNVWDATCAWRACVVVTSGRLQSAQERRGDRPSCSWALAPDLNRVYVPGRPWLSRAVCSGPTLMFRCAYAQKDPEMGYNVICGAKLQRISLLLCLCCVP